MCSAFGRLLSKVCARLVVLLAVVTMRRPSRDDGFQELLMDEGLINCKLISHIFVLWWAPWMILLRQLTPNIWDKFYTPSFFSKQEKNYEDTEFSPDFRYRMVPQDLFKVRAPLNFAFMNSPCAADAKYSDRRGRTFMIHRKLSAFCAPSLSRPSWAATYEASWRHQVRYLLL